MSPVGDYFVPLNHTATANSTVLVKISFDIGPRPSKWSIYIFLCTGYSAFRFILNIDSGHAILITLSVNATPAI